MQERGKIKNIAIKIKHGSLSPRKDLERMILPEINKAEILQRAQEVFFEAMLDGYASGENRKSHKVKTPFRTTITFTSGPFKVVDDWHTTPFSNKSCGTTTIFFSEHFPIWWMEYSGSYSKQAIPCLKSALRQAYEKKEFRGGRGQPVYISGEMLYSNTLEFDQGFEKFEGSETIYVVGSDCLGFHNYSGMSLL